jgi:hypothetical protein
LLAKTPIRGDERTSITARVTAPSVRHVTMIVDPRSARVAHGEIARRLSEAGVQVSVAYGRQPDDLPSSIELLLRLERMATRTSGSLGEKHNIDARGCSAASPDLTLDFSGTALPAGHTLRVLYDGVAGERALMGALLAGRMPSVELQDAASGAIVSRGFPGTEDASTIHAALEAVLGGLITLTLNTVRGWGTCNEAPVPVAQSPGVRELVLFEARSLAHAVLRRLYHLCCHAPHWRVCWRFIDGADLWDSGTLAGTSWQVLPDPGTHLYADPFPFMHQGRLHVFVEDLDHRTNKGVISVVPFGDTGPSGPARIVLEERSHLSYPFVFERDGQIWMIPESSANATVSLYRAERFPDRWVKETDLLTGITASDATIVEHAGRLWMFATTRDGAGSFSDTLSIFHAAHLRGPWKAHDANPILLDQSCARPAGAFVRRHGKLWRPVQDCRAGYGTGIGLAEVVRLDLDGYAQKLHSVIRPGPGWPGRRLHTLNRAGAFECIDGAAHSPRSRILAGKLEAWSGRRELTKSAAGGSG